MKDYFPLTIAKEIGDSNTRTALLEKAYGLGFPSAESEDWRYSPIDDFDFNSIKFVTKKPAYSVQPNHLPEGEWSAYLEIVNGYLIDYSTVDGMEIQSTQSGPSEDVNDAFFYINRAFNPEEIQISIADHATIEAPIIIINRFIADNLNTIIMPRLKIDVGASANVKFVEYQLGENSGFSFGSTHIKVGQASDVHYAKLQDYPIGHCNVEYYQGSVDQQSNFTSYIAAMGSTYSRTKSDIRLQGRGATGNIYAANYGIGNQVHDFRITQHHLGKDTKSDLTFKGVVDDKSGSIYTGLINIHPEAPGSNAFQTNRNIKLSDEAWAWSVPNLEIENNDVKCSHASTVSPIDYEQQFYLQARGVEPSQTDQLIVKGFFAEIAERFETVNSKEWLTNKVYSKIAQEVEK